MSGVGSKDLVVLARGRLDDEYPALAIRVALVLPLAGVNVRLILADAASSLALEEAPTLGPWTGGLARALESLIGEEGVPVLVETESLVELGLAGRALRPGVAAASRAEVVAACSQSGSFLVL
ncbi:MAG: hypothetical protein ACRENX_01790 [Candidatus Dormibacteria bacterium]